MTRTSRPLAAVLAAAGCSGSTGATTVSIKDLESGPDTLTVKQSRP
ncbi:hypothetical protein [Kitasatospora fiedleri]|nr:hypothetical protein [Kitasatospora fiedleri]